jgi:hypothetical protein
MPRPPETRTEPVTTPAPPRTTTTGKQFGAILPDRRDAHCPRCACRCRCHRPPPEPPYVSAPPEPGAPFWSAWLAELRVA